ncbi:MAG: AMIN domain-containing protein, partial [Betaproteobacteria bacterium]|nr:AMIN domain-containing protein [Betaproteobacteria bacterium]
MKTKTGVSLLMAVAAGLSLYGVQVQAQIQIPSQTQAPNRAQEQVINASSLNSIRSLNVADDGGTLYVRLTTKTPLKVTPASFTVANPPRIAFDFPGMSNDIAQSVHSIERGDLRSINIVQVGDRTRVVLNMSRLLSYDTRVNGNTLIIALSQTSGAASTPRPAGAPIARAAASVSARPAFGQRINDINFRRGERGEGRVVVQLSSADTNVDVRQQGGKLIVSFPKTTLPENLRRRSDV